MTPKTCCWLLTLLFIKVVSSNDNDVSIDKVEELAEEIMTAICDNREGIQDKMIDCVVAIPDKMWEPLRACTPDQTFDISEEGLRTEFQNACNNDVDVSNEDTEELLQCVKLHEGDFEKAGESFTREEMELVSVTCGALTDVYQKEGWIDRIREMAYQKK